MSGNSLANQEEEEHKAAYLVPGEEPNLHAQAMSCPDAPFWEDAEEHELSQITKLSTYKLVPLPPGRSAIGSCWVYKIKRDNSDQITQYRAHVVAQGFTQRPGIDFFETYAPVARIGSIQILLSIAASLDWEIHLIDIHLAFLNSNLPDGEDIYLKQPPGYIVKGKEDWVWLLIRALYGLKQAGHLWYEKLKDILIKMGFDISHSDLCVFIRRRNSNITFISSHVDDLGLFCNSKKEVAMVKSEFLKYVTIKDLGEIKIILGIEISCDRSKHTISLSHRQYIINMVQEYNQTNCKPVHTPMEMGTRLSQADSPQTPKEISAMRSIPYQNLVGTLNHAAVMTQPDISKAVQSVAQFSSNPGSKHWNAALRIVKYLNTTKDWVLTLGGKLDSKIPTFIAYSDADHANHADHGQSISGYGILNVTCDGIGGVHSWCSKKQTSTALSTHEAEYISSVNTGREVVWEREFYSELGFVQKLGTRFLTDNNSALRTINSPDQITNRTKHIHYNYHWIKDEAQKQIILPEHVSSELNAADIFTKGFHASRHNELCRVLGVGPRDDAC